MIGADFACPTLELLLFGGEFVAKDDCVLAYVGANSTLEVDGRPIPVGSSFSVRAGQNLRIGQYIRGVRGYLALGARCETGLVGKGALLPALADGPLRRLADGPASLRGGPIRVLAGPQASLLPGDFLDRPWAVSRLADRRGIRLDSPELPRVDVPELPSEPACIGAIQVTSGGQPIILGPDGPTIGGYPKVAVVIEADLDRLAQLKSGDPVRFENVHVEQASEALIQHEHRLEALVRMLRVSAS